MQNEADSNISAGEVAGAAPSAALSELNQWISQFRSAVIAYSGGVDSALVLAAATRSLGSSAMGCIGVSPSYPARELEAATSFAKRIGARFRLVQTQEHQDPRYLANPGNRCYFCKSDLYARLGKIARDENAEVLLDGTNASDLSGHRPGYAAAREHGVRSPLAELHITKAQVRQLAREMNLDVWDKPAVPCLASRVPTGTPVLPQLLGRIEKAEDALSRLGFREFRVRHHGEVARVELPIAELTAAVLKRNEIVEAIRAAGYRFVTLDLGGLQSGSLSGTPAGASNSETH